MQARWISMLKRNMVSLPMTSIVKEWKLVFGFDLERVNKLMRYFENS